MSQQLILPINKCKLTASYKTEAYRQRFGLVHFGADMVSAVGDTTLYASGVGNVIAAGPDKVVGNVLVVLYTDALHRPTGKSQDVIFRYFHLASIAVKPGQKVDKDTALGRYGNTGQLSTGAHLHLEVDTDTEFPLFSPSVNDSNFLRGRVLGANDKTLLNPLDWLHLKTDAPENQTYTTAGDMYIREEDKSIPALSVTDKQTALEIPGIDVSKHNGAIDWDKVAASGKKFAMIRLGWAGYDGRIVANGGLDSLFHANMKGALDAGLDVGVFVYSYCKTAAAARVAAEETLELVKPYRLSYPIAFDIESTSIGEPNGTPYDLIGKAVNNAIVAAFLLAIEAAGYYPILYTYKDFAEKHLNMAALSRWDMWIAQYAAACTYKGAYSIWQHHGDKQPNHPAGSCPGVNGACDLNTAYKDYPVLIRAAGMNGLEAPPDPTLDSSPDSVPEPDPDNLDTLRREVVQLRHDNAVVQTKLDQAIESAYIWERQYNELRESIYSLVK